MSFSLLLWRVPAIEQSNSKAERARITSMTIRTRNPSVRLKNARKHTLSSQRWLVRQLNDPYVAESKRLGYRSRAAFKIAEIDDKYKIFRAGSRVLDLGCAPGGWIQVALERTAPKRASTPKDDICRVVGVDLLEVATITGALIFQGDFLMAPVAEQVVRALDGQADVVMSDMAASSTGHGPTDHLRIMGLLDAAYACAQGVLAKGGSFVGKVLQGGTERDLLLTLKQDFDRVVHFKPGSSRKDSAEMYVVALGFRGRPQAGEQDAS